MVDGFIALGRGMAGSIPAYQKLIESNASFVSLYPIEGLQADCVYVDTRKAFCQLTNHLIGLGHKEIGLLLETYESQYTINREAGFRDAMQAAGLEVRPEWIQRVAPDGTPVVESVSSAVSS